MIRLTFNELEVVEPGVVVHRICRDLLLVLQLSLLEDDVFDSDSFAELLLVGRVVLVQLGALVLWQAVQRETVDGSGSIVFL